MDRLPGCGRRRPYSRRSTSVAPLDQAGPGDLVFLDNPRYADALAGTRATACLVQKSLRRTSAARNRRAHHRRALPRLRDRRRQALSGRRTAGIAIWGERRFPGSFVHPDARLEAGVIVDPGAVIGPRAEIGAGSVIGANAVIGPDVRIGRECAIGPERDPCSRADRRPRHHSSRRAYRPGRFRLRDGSARPHEGAAGRTRRHSERRRDRRQCDDRSWRQPRHDHRRGDQDRQSRADCA